MSRELKYGKIDGWPGTYYLYIAQSLDINIPTNRIYEDSNQLLIKSKFIYNMLEDIKIRQQIAADVADKLEYERLTRLDKVLRVFEYKEYGKPIAINRAILWLRMHS